MWFWWRQWLIQTSIVKGYLGRLTAAGGRLLECINREETSQKALQDGQCYICTLLLASAHPPDPRALQDLQDPKALGCNLAYIHTRARGL